MRRHDIYHTAQVIERQAIRLGYTARIQTARTGTTYLTVEHPAIEGERLIRVSDHEPNEARYKFRVNREPDLCVDPGFQAAAVAHLARWAGVDPATVPYLKREATRRAKIAKAAAEIRARMEAERLERLAESARLYAAASPEDRAIADTYATLRGKARKRYGHHHAAALRRAGARS